MLVDHPLILRRCPDGITNNIIASVPHNPFIESAYHEAKQLIEGKSSLKYLDLGVNLFNRLYNSGKGNNAVFIDHTLYEPATMRQWKQSLLGKCPSNTPYWNPEAVGYHIFGQETIFYRGWTTEQLLNGDHFICSLLRRALRLEEYK